MKIRLQRKDERIYPGRNSDFPVASLLFGKLDLPLELNVRCDAEEVVLGCREEITQNCSLTDAPINQVASPEGGVCEAHAA